MTPSKDMAPDQSGGDEIMIRDAHLVHSPNNIVLNGFNMTVKKGTIFGLLGPSGCGKTTVLNCITGISTLDSGTITLRCRDRGQIGYMPQEVALMEKFKICELLHYFGKIYEMDYETIEERVKELLMLVNLTPDQCYHQYIESLSGGEKRRVSLLVALIHDPALLILDEPTVGLDPSTRASLWEYFLKETENHQKTILITTHYIEEARQSHSLGLMREGVLLAEGPAEKLMNDFACSSLEEAFLHLCRTQGISSPETKHLPKPKQPVVPPLLDKNACFSLNRLTAQAKKNFYWMKRNQWMVAYILLLPGLMSFLFCMLHTKNLKGLRIATVSEEICPNHTTSYQEPICDKEYKASCLFIQLMRNKGYDVIEFPDLTSGMDTLRRGRSLALLHFGRNYTSALLDYLGSTSVEPPPEPTIDNCRINVTTDMTQKLKAGQVMDDVRELYLEMQSELLKSCGYKTSSYASAVGDPVKIFGKGTIDFVHNALPGFIIPLVFYMASAYSSTAAGSERSSGVYRRSLVSGVTKLEINIALVSVQLMVLLVQNGLIVVMLYMTSHSPMEGSALLATTFILMSELQGILYGIFLASIIRNESHLTNATAGTVMSLFLSSGMIWPIEGMEPWLRRVIDFCPVTKAVEAYRSISFRGWGLDNPKVLSAFLYNMATVAVLVAANIISAKSNRTC